MKPTLRGASPVPDRPLCHAPAGVVLTLAGLVLAGCEAVVDRSSAHSPAPPNPGAAESEGGCTTGGGCPVGRLNDEEGADVARTTSVSQGTTPRGTAPRIPPIDAAAPARTETATFALG